MTEHQSTHPLARTSAGMTFGVLLPHFGPHATRERILKGAQLIEDLGFDAVWARDHLLWHPHAHEAGTDPTFLEQFTTLATVGAVTERLYVGTGVMIPIRTPVRVAQQFATLSFLTGGRVVAGIGAGHERSELKASNLDAAKRHEAVVEMIEIVRRLWDGEEVDFEGEVYHVEHAALRPLPVAPIPIAYGGPSRRAVRLAAQHADGWLAGTLPLATIDDRLPRLREVAEARGKRMWLGAVPRTMIHRDRKTARSWVDVEAMSHDGKRHWVTPPSGSFSTIDDIRGALLVGEPMDIVEGVLEFAQRGFDHFSFDVRGQFDRFEDSLELIAERVLPELRAATASAPSET